MANWNQKRAVAEHLGMDYAEMGEYEYQPGRHGKFKVYAVGDFYYMAARWLDGHLPVDYEWKKQDDPRAREQGWLVYRAKMVSEEDHEGVSG